MSTATPRSTIDLEQEKAELLRIRDLDRQAHFTTDVQAALSFFGDTYLYVRDGETRQRSRADLEQTYKEYFRNATFHEWDDMEPPTIRISDDGSMAWMIRRFRVGYTRQEAEQAVEEGYVYAGVTLYEKQKGKWVRVANVSTFAPK